ncbi:four helix bundle protein [Kaistella jeonii]|uniref:30S ribosomal protein S23 n=1 Tax=Kaistella jeonii TaxID=266749 RepID=A0A0C1CW05_9FLAO|nr:four helix bundle protein [Kaistella jeonii]KIA88536.1 30S ribosomal protein S23 [Kaistella jeonii]SFC20310.1 four helix bundle protein [Kaistella jeonii]VEI96994.1 four helix bundle protein [Kaistella jeonii]
MYTDFTQMPVWKKGMDIAVDVFFISNSLPRKEDYALTSQIRRSAESISANISEGFGRAETKDKTMFYKFSRGYETKNHLIYGNLVRYFELEKTQIIIAQIERLIHELNKIIKTLESNLPPTSHP